MRYRTLLLWVSLLIPAMASATLPELAPVIRAAQPVGSAQLRAWWMDIYTASFWSDSGSWQKTPYALSLTYAMGFTPEEMADRTAKEMKRVSSLSADARAAYARQLKAIWPEIMAGDRLTALAQQDRTSFYHNGRLVGSIDGPEFMQAFFAIWLSPDSSEPGMQRQLLTP